MDYRSTSRLSSSSSRSPSPRRVDQGLPSPAQREEAPGTERGELPPGPVPVLVAPERAAEDGPTAEGSDDDDRFIAMLVQKFAAATEAAERQASPGNEHLGGLLAAHRPAFAAAAVDIHANGLDELVDDAVQSAANAYQAGFELIPFGDTGGPQNRRVLEEEKLPEKIHALAELLLSGRVTLVQAFRKVNPRGEEARLFVLCELIDTLLRHPAQGQGALGFQAILKAWSEASLPHGSLDFLVKVMAQRAWTPAFQDLLVDGVLGGVETLEPSFSDEHRLTLGLIECWLADGGIPWTCGQTFALQYLFVKAAWGIAAMAEAPERQVLKSLQEQLDQGAISPLEAGEGLQGELHRLGKTLAGLPDEPQISVDELRDIAQLIHKFAAFAGKRALLSMEDARALRRSVNQALLRVAASTDSKPWLKPEELPAEPLQLTRMSLGEVDDLAGRLHVALVQVRDADSQDMASSPDVVTALTRLVDAVEAGADVEPVIEHALAKGAPLELLRQLLLELVDVLVHRAGEQTVFDYRRVLRPLIRTLSDARSVEQLAQRMAKAAGRRTAQVVAVLEAVYEQIQRGTGLSGFVEMFRGHALAMRLAQEVLSFGPVSKELSQEDRRAVERWCYAIDAHAAPFLKQEARKLANLVPM
jgi:hypothetical protein